MNEGASGILLVISIVLGIWLWQDSRIIEDYRNALSSANSSIEIANSNIEYANFEIQNVNSSIEDAQSVAWSDYESMGQAIEGLTTIGSEIEIVSTVSDPHPK